MSKVWMKVTADEYELPLVVAYTASELAKMCGVDCFTVYKAAWRKKKGLVKRSQYICVEVDDDDDE